MACRILVRSPDFTRSVLLADGQVPRRGSAHMYVIASLTNFFVDIPGKLCAYQFKESKPLPTNDLV